MDSDSGGGMTEKSQGARVRGRGLLYTRSSRPCPAPEMHTLRVPIDSSGFKDLKPVSAPVPIFVEEGRD